MAVAVNCLTLQKDSDRCEELGHKLGSVVGQKTGQNKLWDDQIIHKNGHCVRRGYWEDWYGPGQFCMLVR